MWKIFLWKINDTASQQLLKIPDIKFGSPLSWDRLHSPEFKVSQSGMTAMHLGSFNWYHNMITQPGFLSLFHAWTSRLFCYSSSPVARPSTLRNVSVYTVCILSTTGSRCRGAHCSSAQSAGFFLISCLCFFSVWSQTMQQISRAAGKQKQIKKCKQLLHYTT